MTSPGDPLGLSSKGNKALLYSASLGLEDVQPRAAMGRDSQGKTHIMGKHRPMFTSKRFSQARQFVIAGLMGMAAANGAAAAEITGAGATFPYPIYAKWADLYQKETGDRINYQSIGSGGGIRQIKENTVIFGASDMPLKKDELDQAGLLQWPMVMGGVVPVVNLAGIKPGELKLTGQVLADIFMGKIKKWDDAAIKQLNPGANLPSRAITVVHRSDGSGTTFNFSYYLAEISPEWKSKVGTGTAVNWPAGVGGKGNEGVSSYVAKINGGIGYVEYAYAQENHLVYTQLRNQSGKFVQPDIKSFKAAAANANWKAAPGNYLILANEPGEDTWPMTAASFILMHKKQENEAKTEEAKAALKFFAWAYDKGDQAAEQLNYVPMPNQVVDLVKSQWQQEMRGANGEALWK